ncbi:hypothetical protein, partial [Pseudomonas lactis]|uniref:hypothetical protein n=1 Tax=Pseudomonas lactis TaxID=1615674 RepID=UPI001F382273
TSTLNVHIADFKTVTALNDITTTALAMPDPVLDAQIDDSQAAPEMASKNALPSLNTTSEQKLDLSKLVSLQPKTSTSEQPLKVKWEDLMKTDSPALTAGSTLDLPDSWKADGQKTAHNGNDYLHYIDAVTKQEVWVQSGISVV